MNKFAWLLNHGVMIALLVASVVTPLVINAAFDLAPRRLESEIVAFSFISVYGLWPILIADGLKLFGPLPWLRWILILGFLAGAAFVHVPTISNFEANHLVGVAQAVNVSIAVLFLSLSALIASRISNSQGAALLNFFLILNWPLTLFAFASKIRTAALQSEPLHGS